MSGDGDSIDHCLTPPDTSVASLKGLASSGHFRVATRAPDANCCKRIGQGPQGAQDTCGGTGPSGRIPLLSGNNLLFADVVVLVSTLSQKVPEHNRDLKQVSLIEPTDIQQIQETNMNRKHSFIIYITPTNFTSSMTEVGVIFFFFLCLGTLLIQIRPTKTVKNHGAQKQPNETS